MRLLKSDFTNLPLNARTALPRAACTLVCAIAAGSPAALAQAPAAAHDHAAPPAQSAQNQDDVERARLLGLLVYTEVTITLDNTPARDALAMFKQATGIPLVPRWRDDAVGFGLEPATPISITAQAQPAIDVLEQILEQCEVFEDCTWQLRKGFVEVGTKQRLSVPSARVTRMYDIRHLMLEPPIFAYKDPTPPSERKYNSAFTGKRTEMMKSSTGYTFRKNPDELADEVVIAVVETIEPGMWDVGEDDVPAEQHAPTPRPETSAPATPASGEPAAAPTPALAPTVAPAAVKALPRSRTGVGKWATLRVWRDHMIIKAPDFMHRQIDGYPEPIMPEGGVRQVVAVPISAPGEAAPSGTTGESDTGPSALPPRTPGAEYPGDDGPSAVPGSQPGRPPSDTPREAPRGGTPGKVPARRP
jgi:hypothetical protein